MNGQFAPFDPQKPEENRILIPQLSRNFLLSAQELADAILTDLGKRDPEMGASVAKAVQQGERLSLAFVFDQQEPKIELDCCNDYGSRRLVASIPLQGKEPAREN